MPFLIIILASATLVASAHAQTAPVNPDLLSTPWDASWIEHPEAPPTEFGVYHFRRTFDLDEQPQQFIVHVSADNRYRLFVNGRPVVWGPARGDLMHWRFESVDIGPFLRPGSNTLAAVVWNFAGLRPMAQFTHRTAFILQGDSEKESAVNTGTDWRVVQNGACEPIPVSLPNTYIVVGPGEQVDGASYPWGWEQPDFDDGGWLAAEIVRHATQHLGARYGEYSGWKLVPRDIPLMEERQERIPQIRRSSGFDPHSGFLKGLLDLTVPAQTRASFLLDQTHLTTAYPELLVSDGAGSRITFTYAEALRDEEGQKGHRDEIEGKEILGYRDVFLPDGGERRLFRPLWWRTYRYIQVDIETKDQPLTIHDLYGMFTAYPFEERASFTGSDTTLSTIWRVGWRTARLCAGETYFDCPYYEQLQYSGDTRIQALISLYVSGDDRLVRRAIRDFDHSRIPEGLTTSRYPAWETQFIPPYSLFWIAMVHDYWMHRDDPDFVAGFLTGVRGVIEWYEGMIDETGMLGPMPWWNFVDWSFPRGVPPGPDEGNSSIVTLQYIYALQFAAEMADAFGRAEEAGKYRNLAERLKIATYRHCWDEGRGLLADTPDKTSFSEHANVMAVLVDLIPPEGQAPLLRRLAAAEDAVPTTYYYRFYLDRAMKKAGLAGEYLDRMDSWYEMLDLGLTTFAEKDEPTRSDSHAWSASPNYHFLETVCGIEPASPGFRSVRVAPAMGRLEWVDCAMPHPLGEIRVALRLENGALKGEVALPAGLTGRFVLNGKEVPLEGTVDIDL